MPEERDLEKQLKLVAKTGKYVVGRREVMSGIKGTKLLVWSASAGLPQTILDNSKSLQIPAVRFNGNPVELGRACGIPFRVSVIAVKSAGDADHKSFSNSADYSVTAISGPSMMAPPPEPEPPAKDERKMKEDEEAGTRKRRKSVGKEKSEAEPKSTGKKKVTSSKSEEKKGAETEEKPVKKKSKSEESEDKPKKTAKKTETADKKKSPLASEEE